MAKSYWSEKKWRRQLIPAFFPHWVKTDTPLIPICKSLLAVIKLRSNNIQHIFSLRLLAMLTNGLVKLYQRKVDDVFDECFGRRDEICYESDHVENSNENENETFLLEVNTNFKNVQESCNDTDIEVMRLLRRSSSTRGINEIKITRQKTITPIFHSEINNEIPSLEEGYFNKNSISPHYSNQHAFLFEDVVEYTRDNNEEPVETHGVHYSFQGFQRNEDNQRSVLSKEDNDHDVSIYAQMSCYPIQSNVTSRKRKKVFKCKTIPINVNKDTKAHLRCKSSSDDIIGVEKNYDLFSVPSFLTPSKKTKLCVNSKLTYLSKRNFHIIVKSNAKEKLRNSRIQKSVSSEKLSLEKSKRNTCNEENASEMIVREDLNMDSHASDNSNFSNVFYTSSPISLNENPYRDMSGGNKYIDEIVEHCEKLYKRRRNLY